MACTSELRPSFHSTFFLEPNLSVERPCCLPCWLGREREREREREARHVGWNVRWKIATFSDTSGLVLPRPFFSWHTKCIESLYTHYWHDRGNHFVRMSHHSVQQPQAHCHFYTGYSSVCQHQKLTRQPRRTTCR